MVNSEKTPPAPGFPVVGMIGGGQLSRMTAQAAIPLGIDFRVLARSHDESAARVAQTVIGDPDDPAAVAEFADVCDVVTFDHEQVPPAVMEVLAATDAHVRPQPAALQYAQDKYLMRSRLGAADFPNPRWAVASSAADVAEFAAGEWPVVLKVSRGGYDGKGVWVLDSAEAATDVMAQILPNGTRWLCEEFVPFERELAIQVARSPSGQAAAYPVVQTRQRDGVCSEVVAPAPDLAPDVAAECTRIGLAIAAELDVTGMLAVELFQTADGVVVNELAMRPHNSGHWTQDGAFTSQFSNHLRAVLDLPLGNPSARQEWTVMVNILGSTSPDLYRPYLHLFARDPEIFVHLYGKEVRPGRKLGHVNAIGQDWTMCLERAQHAADFVMGEIDE